MPNWGSKDLDNFVSKLHHAPYAAIDPAKVKLTSPYVVCIVGASRDIGTGIATSYAAAGASGLILASRRTSGLQATAAKCRTINPEVEIELVSCDITIEQDVVRLSETVQKRFNGRLDVVALNSGYSGPIKLKITETDSETFRNAVAVNYTGTFYVAKYLIPLLLASPSGSAKAFVGVSSFAAFLVRGPIANTQYTVAKAAQLKLLEHMHEQYSAESEGGLSVFAIHPGAVASEAADEFAPKEFKSFLLDSADLCGATAVWLTKDREKRWLSGRLVSATWDVDELIAKERNIVDHDLLKLGAIR